MKCASTWVSECLRQHPEVLLSTPKETAFFHDHQGLGEYSRFFESEDGGRSYGAVGEFTPTYLPNARVISRRILATLGPVDILVILRHPAKRYLSHYKWVLGRREDFGRDRFSHLDLSTFRRANEVEPRLLEWGHYAEDLEHLFEAFGRKRVHVMIYEQMFAAPEQGLARLFEFLCVDSSFVPPGIGDRVRGGYVPRSRLLERAKVMGYFAVKNYAPWAIDPLKGLGLERLLKRINASKGSALTVTSAFEDELAQHYAPELERVRALLNDPLPEWDPAPKTSA